MRRKEQAEASRAALIEAAAQCFTEQGYEATTVAGILERVGMARGALYHYFPGGKRELFAAVFDSINEAFHERRDAVAGIPSPMGRIRAAAEVFLELCTEAEFARILLIEGPKHVPGQDQRGSTYALLRAQLDEARSLGELPDVDTEITATALYGAIRAAGDSIVAASDRAVARRDAARVIGHLLDGLTAEPAG